VVINKRWDSCSVVWFVVFCVHLLVLRPSLLIQLVGGASGLASLSWLDVGWVVIWLTVECDGTKFEDVGQFWTMFHRNCKQYYRIL